jgi:tetratricopeptide (TPR) repeat protein
MRTFAACIVTLILASSVCAQADWTGKSVITKNDNVKIGHSENGQQVYTGELKWLQYRVRRDQGGWILVAQDDLEDWALKTDFVLAEEALAYFNDRIREDPKVGGHWYRRALARQLQGDLDVAIREFDEAVRLAPSPAGYINRGACWAAKKDLDKAIADYDAAIRMDPQFVPAYGHRGNAWSAKREFDRAIRDYDEAIRLKPKYVEAINNRGVAWAGKLDYDRAIRDYNEALQLDAKYLLAYFNRGNAWTAKGDHGRAMSDFDALIERDPKFAPAFDARGLTQLALRNFDAAIRDFDKAIELNPKDVAVLCNRGNAYYAKKDFDSAIRDYDSAIQIDPKNVLALCSRANAAAAKKDYPIALRDYDAAIALDPNYTAALSSSSWLRATCPDERYRDGKRAVESATKACELLKWKDMDAIDTLAAAYAETGDFEKAIDMEMKALADANWSKTGGEGGQKRLRLYREKKPYRQD